MAQKIILSILGIAVVLGIALIINKSKNQTAVQSMPGPVVTHLCFYKETTTDRGFKDITSIKMNIEKDSVTGEVRNFPAEKDSKVGTFEGLVVETNTGTRERTADVWWDTLGEGMRVKEELIIKMNQETDGSIKSARMGFGEMVAQADGSYKYKDKNNLTYIEVPSVDCATFVSPQALKSP